MLLDVVIRNLGENRNKPRIYLDMPAVARASFVRGTIYRVIVDELNCKVSVVADKDGDRVVCGKEEKGGIRPVIDLSSFKVLGLFQGLEKLRIVFMHGRIFLLPLASEISQRERLGRITRKLAAGDALMVASLAHGGGILSHAVHAGAKEAGVELHASLVNEIDADLMACSKANNDIWRDDTRGYTVPMQELVQDKFLCDRMPRVDFVEAGIPCSGASKAGASKRGLECAEAHPEVGHLVLPALMLVQTLQPAIVLIENVETYAQSASGFMLRSMLRDMGYTTHEATLNAADFGSLEARTRWFLIAVTNGLSIDLENLAPTQCTPMTVGEILDDIGPDDERWRTFEYLKEKEVRDKAKGNSFAMQTVGATHTRVPVLRKGYHKGGSTDPLLRHPTDPNKLRLFTGSEHSRIKNVPIGLVAGMSETAQHQILGQGIAYAPVKALVKRVIEGVKASAAAGRSSLVGAPKSANYGLKGVG
jgi:DNA (cytosine-5)-methyltransferase 1